MEINKIIKWAFTETDIDAINMFDEWLNDTIEELENADSNECVDIKSAENLAGLKEVYEKIGELLDIIDN